VAQGAPKGDNAWRLCAALMQTVKTPHPSHEPVGSARHLHISIAEDRYIGLALEGLRRPCKNEEESEGCVLCQALPKWTTHDNARVASCDKTRDKHLSNEKLDPDGKVHGYNSRVMVSRVLA
jgi:hypothetical protein